MKAQLAGRWALAAAFMVVGLVAYGSWVRVSGSGLGCPDWPLCNGQVIPTSRASAIESGHRWYAAITLLIVFFAAFLGFRLRRQMPRAAGLLFLAAVLVAVQALLGAVVVLTDLHPFVRLVHLSIAMTIIAVLTVGGLAFLNNADPVLGGRRPGLHLLLTTVAVILLGGSIVASSTSFECATFPLCGSGSSSLANALHGAHRTLGALLFVAAAIFVFRHREAGGTGPFIKASAVAAVLLLVQLGVSVSMVASRLPVDLRVMHVGIAAAIWMALVAAWAVIIPAGGADAMGRRSAGRGQPSGRGR